MKYLFILSPPFSGSTLLSELLSTSKNISSNNNEGTREGQTLPSVREMMFDHNDRWNPNLKYDWKFIKSEWIKYWDTEKSVLLEKSPPNIMRADEIALVFKPAYFICMVRNPYACCERKKRMGDSVVDAAKSSIMQLKYQRKNIESLNNLIFFTYEELTENPKKVKEKIVAFMPELKDINVKMKFSAHNILNKKMKIKKLKSIKN